MMQSGQRDFVLKKKDGRLVMFGGGEYSQDTLPKTDVLEIFSNEHAFAATLKKGGVVAWGRNESGFIEPAKAQKMKDQTVDNIYSTLRAFAALLKDGSVVAWGNVDYGGHISENTEDRLHPMW